MNRLARRHQVLIAVVLVQVVALLGIAVLHGARMAAGTEVRVPVHAVDPLDLARGAYTNVSYDFEALDVPRGRGDVFVVLKRVDGDTGWRATKVVDDEGQAGSGDAWIRLPRTADDKHVDTSSIAAFYASADRARELGNRLTTEGGVARLSLDRGGRPTLLDVTAR